MMMILYIQKRHSIPTTTYNSIYLLQYILIIVMKRRKIEFSYDETNHKNLLSRTETSGGGGYYFLLGRMSDEKEGNYCFLDTKNRLLYDSVDPYKQELKLESFRKSIPIIDECYRIRIE